MTERPRDGYVRHDIDGVPWFQLDPPRRLHRCWAQTTTTWHGDTVRYCPCGGTSLNGARFIERNGSRRK